MAEPLPRRPEHQHMRGV